VVHLAVVIYAAAFVEEEVDADRWVYCCFYPELILSFKISDTVNVSQMSFDYG
jgi:hypothetical protein